MLSQVLVNRLPNKALALLTRIKDAKNNAASGPIPGIIPENTPIPKPNAILLGVSLTLKSFK
jgi:hypothetical protein